MSAAFNSWISLAFAGCFALAALALGPAGCATSPQPTTIAGADQLPVDWFTLQAGDWRVQALSPSAREYRATMQERLAEERRLPDYQFYGRYSDSTLLEVARAQEFLNSAFLTSPRVVQARLTPELHATAETFDDGRRNFSSISNIQQREAADDWTRFWLLDKPSALSPYPIMPTTGQP